MFCLGGAYVGLSGHCMCLASVAFSWASLAMCFVSVQPRGYIRFLRLLVKFAFLHISLRYFLPIHLFVSFVFADVFASPMWAELNHVEDPSLRRLAEKLPKVILGSRADNTTLSYLNAFKRWRSWACKFPEITVLPATPAYVSLYLLSVLQSSVSSPSPDRLLQYTLGP